MDMVTDNSDKNTAEKTQNMTADWLKMFVSLEKKKFRFSLPWILLAYFEVKISIFNSISRSLHADFTLAKCSFPVWPTPSSNCALWPHNLGLNWGLVCVGAWICRVNECKHHYGSSREALLLPGLRLCIMSFTKIPTIHWVIPIGLWRAHFISSE